VDESGTSERLDMLSPRKVPKATLKKVHQQVA